MKTGPSVRDAAPADAADVAELLGQLGYPTSAAEARVRLATGDERVLLAEVGGRVLGLLAVTTRRSITHAHPVARVTAMVVRDSARRQGVGRLLMDSAARLALAEGCESIELTSGIRPERDAAHRFYRSLGYEPSSYCFWRRL